MYTLRVARLIDRSTLFIVDDPKFLPGLGTVLLLPDNAKKMLTQNRIAALNKAKRKYTRDEVDKSTKLYIESILNSMHVRRIGHDLETGNFIVYVDTELKNPVHTRPTILRTN